MTFSDEQAELMARYRRIGQLDDPALEPKTTLTVSKRQMALLLQALAHFRATKCPLEGRPPGCAMVTWREQVSTGAIERVCFAACDTWVDELIRDLPQAFAAGQPQAQRPSLSRSQTT